MIWQRYKSKLIPKPKCVTVGSGVESVRVMMAFESRYF